MGNEKITELMSIVKGMIASKYPVENSLLRASSDFLKNNYLKFLAAVVQNAKSVTDETLNLFSRIVAGAAVNSGVEDFCRQALEIKKENFAEFIGEIESTQLKYRFALDAIILANMNGKDKKQMMLIAYLLQVLKINKAETEFLALLSKSILMQDPQILAQAKLFDCESIYPVCYEEYIKDFLNTEIYYCYSEEHFIALSDTPKDVDFTEYIGDDPLKAVINSKKVVLNNLNISVEVKSLQFLSCDSVTIENCKFTGANMSIILKNVKEVIFKNCSFRNFIQGTVELTEVSKLTFDGCKFNDCKPKVVVNNSGGYSCKSVIHCFGDSCPQASFIACKFHDCRYNSYSDYRGSGQELSAIYNCPAYIADNFFERCGFSRGSSYYQRLFHAKSTSNENNRTNDCSGVYKR